MSLEVRFPDSYLSERFWIVESLIKRFTTDLKIIPENRDDWLITVSGMTGGIHFEDRIIPGLYSDKMLTMSAPFPWRHDCPDLCEKFLPIIGFEEQRMQPYQRHLDGHAHLTVDLFGMAFWSMSRWEEVYTDCPLDKFGRFTSKASYLHKFKILDRPWIDEWMIWLKWQIKKLWPNFNFEDKPGKTILTHDVDFPYLYAFDSVNDLIRRMAGDIFRRKNFWMALKAPLIWAIVKAGFIKFDPYNKFDWIMDHSENIGLKSTFYFISGNSAGRIDGNYSIDHPLIRQLLRKINRRGHQIGLHPSFNSYRSKEVLSQEFEALKKACEAEGIYQDQWSSRQHYLRWSTPETAIALESAGIAIDSTLGFADHIGFRCGTCFEYQIYDVKSRMKLNLKVLPLVVMDVTALGYQGLSHEESASQIRALRVKCFEVNGAFTLLWHNTSLLDEAHRRLYCEVAK